MTQEELYWYEKRLYMQADAKEREIKDWSNRRIRHLGDFGMPEDKQRRERLRIEVETIRAIEFARLEILEPVLDAQKKARLRQLRLEKQQEETRQRIEAERQRKAWEEEEKKRKERERLEEAIRKRQEEEEKRLAPIRAREAAAKAERERIEQKKQERKENTETAIGWIIGILVLGGIIAAVIIFRKWIIAGILVVFGLSILLSD